jgi:hypothetical protein
VERVGGVESYGTAALLLTLIHRSAWRNCSENGRRPLERASSASGSGREGAKSPLSAAFGTPILRLSRFSKQFRRRSSPKIAPRDGFLALSLVRFRRPSCEVSDGFSTSFGKPNKGEAGVLWLGPGLEAHGRSCLARGPPIARCGRRRLPSRSAGPPRTNRCRTSGSVPEPPRRSARR